MSVRTVANCDVVSFAANGKNAQGYGNLRTKSTPNGIARGGWVSGELPNKLAAIMRERADSIVQVIYSYNTPIAWLDAGAWVVPNVSYSVTSSKHQGYLHRLPSRHHSIPWDCSLEEYLRVLNGLMQFVGRGKDMRTAPGSRLTNPETCKLFLDLDAQYNEDPRSPLHHDNRCTAHM